MRSLAGLVARARRFQAEAHVLYLACRDVRTPWYAKAIAALVVAYAFSPIDLIPDPIPVLGHLDDLILVPLGVWIASRLIPGDVLNDCRVRVAERELAKLSRPRNRWGVVLVVAIWVLAAALLFVWFLRRN